MIWQRKFYFYLTGVDLTEEEFKEYHSRKDLKNQYDDITYFLNKANKIVKDLGQNFSWKEFDALYYNRKFTVTQIDNQSESINIVNQIEDYAKKLYEEGFIKTSKGYTTTANHLKGYLKKKDDGLLFGGVINAVGYPDSLFYKVHGGCSEPGNIYYGIYEHNIQE